MKRPQEKELSTSPAQKTLDNFIDVKVPKVKRGSIPIEKWATFETNSKAPIHNWYSYLCGFSNDFVSWCFFTFHKDSSKAIIDPFCGVGTVNTSAKANLIPSIGIEIHPLVAKIANIKTTWNSELITFLRKNNLSLLGELGRQLRKIKEDSVNISHYPTFLLNSFDEKYYESDQFVLQKLVFSLEYFRDPDIVELESARNLYELGVTSILRDLMTATLSSPYISPSRQRKNTNQVFQVLNQKIGQMVEDLSSLYTEDRENTPVTILNKDIRSKDIINEINDSGLTLDLCITSPPYPNNVDYADSTRLELYFLGMASSWKDITDSIRSKLVRSSTVVLQKTDDPHYINENIPEKPKNRLKKIISELSDEKEKRRSGKVTIRDADQRNPRKSRSGKNYDQMIAQYFNDMSFSLENLVEVLSEKAKVAMVIGDSAPYGIYVPVEQIISEIAEGVGFQTKRIEQLRTRGGKWKAIKGSRTHNVPLKECLVLLEKK